MPALMSLTATNRLTASVCFARAEVVVQPVAGAVPPPGGGRPVAAEGGPGLGHRQAGEEPEFDEFRLERLGRREPVQRVVEVDQSVRRLGGRLGLVELDTP